MKRVIAALATTATALLLASPAQAWYTGDQCERMTMGATSTWAPDNDVMAMWNYYESRGLNIVSATPDYINGNWDSNGAPRYVGWIYTRKSGHTKYVTFRCYYSNGHHDQLWSYT